MSIMVLIITLICYVVASRMKYVTQRMEKVSKLKQITEVDATPEDMKDGEIGTALSSSALTFRSIPAHQQARDYEENVESDVGNLYNLRYHVVSLPCARSGDEV